MAIPSGVARLVISGALPGAGRWAVNLWSQLPPAGNRTTAQEAADAVATGSASDVRAVITAAAALMSQETTVDRIDQYYYTGAQAASDHGQATYNQRGTSTHAAYNQLCVVTTLRTAAPTRSGRGRIYWPATGAAESSSGLHPASPIQALLNALENVRDIPGDTANLVVVSQTQSVFRPVTRVDADRVLDTQRGRTGDLATARLIGV